MNLHVRGALLLATAAGLTTGPLLAQFLNRAVWLGLDEEGVRRNFAQGTEYYLDRMSYVDLAPWWDRGLLRFGNQVGYRLGSVSSTDFTIEGHLNQQVDLGEGLSFRYHYLQSEHRDARFVRNAIALEYATSERTAWFVQATPFADKERIDVSIGTWLYRERDDGIRLMVTMVDAPSEKSRQFEFARDPIGLHLAATFGDRDSHRIAVELGSQMPFELRRLEDLRTFEMQRHIATVTTHLRLGDRDWLVGHLESEVTQKSLRGLTSEDSTAEEFGRTFHQARIEWFRDCETPWSVGLVHTYQSEHGRRPNDAANNLRSQRREWFGIARVQLPVSERFSFEPQLLAGNVKNSFFDGVSAADDDQFEGKIAWNVRWDFNANVSLSIIVSTQLDELAFGGGGAQFVARF